MIAVDIVLYMVLIWYLEVVFPGKYGVSKPWYFPFLPSYWLGQERWNHLKLYTWPTGKASAGHGPTEEEEEMSKSLESAIVCFIDSWSSNVVLGTQEEGEGPVCEDEPVHLLPGIQIKNLAKASSSLCTCLCKKERKKCARQE